MIDQDSQNPCVEAARIFSDIQRQYHLLQKFIPNAIERGDFRDTDEKIKHIHTYRTQLEQLLLFGLDPSIRKVLHHYGLTPYIRDLAIQPEPQRILEIGGNMLVKIFDGIVENFRKTGKVRIQKNLPHQKYQVLLETDDPSYQGFVDALQKILETINILRSDDKTEKSPSPQYSPNLHSLQQNLIKLEWDELLECMSHDARPEMNIFRLRQLLPTILQQIMPEMQKLNYAVVDFRYSSQYAGGVHPYIAIRDDPKFSRKKIMAWNTIVRNYDALFDGSIAVVKTIQHPSSL